MWKPASLFVVACRPVCGSLSLCLWNLPPVCGSLPLSFRKTPPCLWKPPPCLWKPPTCLWKPVQKFARAYPQFAIVSPCLREPAVGLSPWPCTSGTEPARPAALTSINIRKHPAAASNIHKLPVAASNNHKHLGASISFIRHSVEHPHAHI